MFPLVHADEVTVVVPLKTMNLYSYGAVPPPAVAVNVIAVPTRCGVAKFDVSVSDEAREPPVGGVGVLGVGVVGVGVVGTGVVGGVGVEGVGDDDAPPISKNTAR